MYTILTVCFLKLRSLFFKENKLLPILLFFIIIIMNTIFVLKEILLAMAYVFFLANLYNRLVHNTPYLLAEEK